MFVSFWALNPDGTYDVPLPDVESWTLSPVAGAPGVVSLAYPADGRNFEVLREQVTQDRDLEIAVWLDGQDAGSLRALLNTSDGDDVAESAVWTFSGNLLPVRMEEAVVTPRTEVIDPPTGPPPTEDLAAARFYSATAGQILATLMQEAQARGALTDIVYDFDNTLDSFGTPWSTVITLKIAPGTTYLKVLDSVVGAQMCEWDLVWNGQARELVMWEADTRGVDHTEVDPPLILRAGQTLTDAPRKHSVRDAGTTLLLAGGEGLYDELSDTTALARRGRRIERYASQGSLTDPGSLAAYGQVQLQLTVNGVMEVGHGIALEDDGPRPLLDYTVGDWVFSDTGHGLERFRIAQLTVSGDKDGVTAAGASLNDLIADDATRLSRRIDGIEGGSTITGTSQARPVEDGPDLIAPAVPQGLVVTSLAYNGSDGTPLASLFAQWAPVTTQADGTAIDDLAGYLVRFRYSGVGLPEGYLGGGQQFDTAAADVAPVLPGVLVYVQVAAIDTSGNLSGWSAEVGHTTETDATPPPDPSVPVVASYLGLLRVDWDGLGSLGEVMPPDFEHVEVHLSTTSGFTPDRADLSSSTTYVGQMYGAGTLPIALDGYGTTFFVRLVAIDTTGNPSDPSPQGSAVLEQVGDGDIAAVSIGKLTTGIMSALMSVSGIIQTATMGSRVRLDTTGFRCFNSFEEEVMAYSIATGLLRLVGKLSTGPDGSRVEIRDDGFPTIAFYSTPTTKFAFINSFDDTDSNIGLGLNSAESDDGTHRSITYMRPDAVSHVIATPAQAPIGGQLAVERNAVTASVRRSTGSNQIAGGRINLNRAPTTSLFGYFDQNAGISRHMDAGPDRIRFFMNGSARLDINDDAVIANLLGSYEADGRAILGCGGNQGGVIGFRAQGGDTDAIIDTPKGPRFIKNFVIDHPVDPDRWLVHACTETPEAAVEYSGHVIAGEWGDLIEVQLPDYFEALTRTSDRQVWLQPMLNPDAELMIYMPRAVPSYPRDGKFFITTDAQPGSAICWKVKAVRRDVEPLDVAPSKDDGQVRGDGPYTYFVPRTEAS